ncbi:MAG: oxidoreductase [Candidatus Aenigmatarchaeota archaeon]
MGWTEEEMGDLGGKTVVVTGANSGLGYAATKKLARHGAEVVMACRSSEKSREALKSIKRDIPDPEVILMELDLADLDSVRSFAGEFRRRYDSLDVLCNNAGVMALPRRETEDGFEMQLGVNHLGHFALTAHLMDLIIDSGGRVVNQSSMAHENGEMDFNDLMMEEEYSKWGAYSRSKLANLLFTYELDRRLKEIGSEACSVACHPGVSDTDLFRKGPRMEGSKIKLLLGSVLTGIFGQSPDRGCLPMLYAATSADIDGGEYIGPDGFKSMRGYPEKQESSEASHDGKDARKLWERSEELTGVEFMIDEK